MEKFSRFFNALFILVLMGILFSAYYQQYFKHEIPCPLCILQRIAMFGIALGLLLNLKHGIRPSHYGLSLLFAIFGRTVSLRQIALHVCPGFPAFGVPVWGFNLYTWAFFSFGASAFAIAILLFLMPKERTISKMNGLEWLAAMITLILLLSNALTTYWQCSFGPCEDVPWQQPIPSPSETPK